MYSGFNSLILEPTAATGTEGKKMLHYDSHEKRLKESGWERAPTPQEAMGLIIAHLEGRLDQKLGKIAANMLERHGEFFCHAVQVSDGNLFFYENATGLFWNGECYKVYGNNSWHKSQVSFKVAGINHGWNDLEFISKISPEVIEYLYSRKYQELPQAIRESGRIYFPDDNLVWPIGRACKPDFGILLDCRVRGSRGVRLKNDER